MEGPRPQVSSRSRYWSDALFEEFQILDNISRTSNFVQAPLYTSNDLDDEELLKKLLIESPSQLVKFIEFKKVGDENENDNPSGVEVDRRLNRMKNLNSPPIGSWAKWVTSTTYWQNFMLYMILINAVAIGIQIELNDNPKVYYLSLEILNLFDYFALLIFVLEILLKWLDNFESFWKNGWNVFDFVVTLISAIPEIMLLFIDKKDSGDASLLDIAEKLRSFRVFRTFKLIVRFSSLRIIVLTIIDAFQSMAFIMMLLFIIAYIFAIIAVNVFESHHTSDVPDLQYKDAFRRLSLYISSCGKLEVSGRIDVKEQRIVSNFSNISEVLKKRTDDEANYQKSVEDSKKFEKERKSRILASEQLKPENFVSELFEQFRESQAILTAPLKETEAGEDASDDRSLNQPQPSVLSGQDSIKQKMFLFMAAGEKESNDWDETVMKNLKALGVQRKETMWPRDTLFEYFRNMERLMENMTEYRELEMLAALSLLETHDT
eukprot:Nk52_evm15s159 gene=Nk52_evmTU15s159